jgi:phytol kinase
VTPLVRELAALFTAGALCAAALALAELLRHRLRAPAEVTRKLAHVVTGLVTCGFPWLFRSPWSVTLLCASFLGLLAWSARRGRLASINGVSRRSVGAVWFPAAVALVFWWSDGRPELFVPAMLVLSVSDTLAALVGQAFGRHAYRPFGEVKSLEGSLAFLTSAFVCVLVCLLHWTPLDVVEGVVCALAVALIATGLEAVSVLGSDNLTVPVGTCWAVAWFAPRPVPSAIFVGLVMLALLGILLLASGGPQRPGITRDRLDSWLGAARRPGWRPEC